MFIVSKDREVVVNADNTTNIYIENGNKILARMVDSEEVVLGFYVTGAKSAFEKMLNAIFIPNMIAINTVVTDDYAEKFKGFGDAPWGIAIGKDEDIKPIPRAVYYMPEE